MTETISKEMKEFTKNHGGVLYIRKYYDDEKITSNDHTSMSWQTKCKTGTFSYMWRLSNDLSSYRKQHELWHSC